jgi:hypothetical protein
MNGELRFSPQIKTKCLTCCSRTPESILYLFWACPLAKTAWTFALKILFATSPHRRHLESFNSHHALFVQRMPRRFHYLGIIWVYLRSVMFWTTWVARNDTVFNQYQWPRAKVEGTIWTNLTDYSRAVCRPRNSKWKQPNRRPASSF